MKSVCLKFSRTYPFIQLMINFILFLFIESVELCTGNDTTNGKSLLLITFDSGSDEYSNKTPAYFNFSAAHEQKFASPEKDGIFVFVKAVPNDPPNNCHTRALDHTPDDGMHGYMYYVRVFIANSQLFNFTLNNLCIGVRYEFSAYLGNVVKKEYNLMKPNIRFEVRMTTAGNPVLAEFSTGDIPEYDTMTWSKCGLSFIASTNSVVLLIISNFGAGSGNNIAIDDIELRISPIVHSGFCFAGQYIRYCLNKR